MMTKKKVEPHKITNKENLISELGVALDLLKNEKNAEKKALVESLFCLQQFITHYLIDTVFKNAVFEVLENDRR